MALRSAEQNLCATLVEGIMRNNSLKLFEFGPVVQEETSFKDNSYLEPWWPFSSSERNPLCNSGRGSDQESSKPK